MTVVWRQHHSRDPIEAWAPTTYLLKTDLKPPGLWYSAGDTDIWPDWCKTERFRLEWLRYSHALEVDLNRVLLIDTVAKLDEFQAAYGEDLYERPRLSDYIAWHEVAKHFAGVEIAPYFWERRMDGGLWYRSWDCASGVLWDLDALLAWGEPVATGIDENPPDPYAEQEETT